MKARRTVSAVTGVLAMVPVLTRLAGPLTLAAAAGSGEFVHPGDLHWSVAVLGRARARPLSTAQGSVLGI